MSSINSFTPLWGVWEIESTLGEGSFGKVYKAVREEFGRRYECAIKHISLPQNDAEVKQLLDEQMSNDISIASDYYRQIVEDIVNEIEIMHTLRGNTNIVAYEDHLILPKKSGIGYDIFIRMELLKELSERGKEGELTEGDVVKLGIDVCTALEVCAAKNLIHRDIKPQNIFINAEGHYKLGDFGISRQLEKTTGGLSKKGTYLYMAPEVYRGLEYGANVDIYSLGLLMYRLLNGNRLPFLPLPPAPVRYDDNEKALARRINGEEMPAPAFASEALAKIILNMCTYNRDDRHKTASEVKNELLSISSHEKTNAMFSELTAHEETVSLLSNAASMPIAQAVRPVQPQATINTPPQVSAANETNPYDTPQVRDLIGKNADYYIRKFHGIETKSKRVPWNWSAFLNGVFWLIYRKMHKVAVVSSVIWIAGVITFLVLAGLSVTISWRAVAELSVVLLFIVLTIGWPIVMGCIGTRLYKKHIDRKIGNSGR